MAKGIDVSKWQGSIDWAAVKAGGVAFAMLRASVGTAADSRFAEYAAGAAAAGIPIGAYHYLTSTTAAGAKREAAFFLSQLAGKRLEYPAVLDLEEPNQLALPDGELMALAETFLAVDDPGASVVIEPDPDFGDGFDYLDGMDFANINRAAEKATIQAHAAGGVPCMVLRLPRIDERTFGLVYYFFMVACALSGRLLGVDPFDQEGVEEYKRSMFAALGKPGVKGR